MCDPENDAICYSEHKANKTSKPECQKTLNMGGHAKNSVENVHPWEGFGGFFQLWVLSKPSRLTQTWSLIVQPLVPARRLYGGSWPCV